MKPTDPALFFTRHDPEDPRLGEWVRPLAWDATLEASLAEESTVIIGWPDDEGIRLNGGRPGAALAPSRIRKFLYRMTPDRGPNQNLFDGGDLDITMPGSLLERHAEARKSAIRVLRTGAKLITLGGGHDFGYPDAASFCEIIGEPQPGDRVSTPRYKPLVLNFDAHLDVRPLDHRGPNSGSPFFRLLSEFNSIDFVEIGIQRQCNSKMHERWLTDRGARIVSYDEMASASSYWDVLHDRVGDWVLKRRPAFVSVDIDAFSSAIAPGCSQSWATGLDIGQFLFCFRALLARLDVVGLGLYEVSPELDSDDRTSKLAAQIAYEFLFPGEC
jgi:formiminoglutamase